MLELTLHQFDLLGEYARKRYEDLLFLHLLEEFPEKIVLSSEDNIKNDMLKYLKSALDAEIDRQGAAAIYVNLCFTFGIDLAFHPDGAWSWDLLGNKQLDCQEKMRILNTRLAGGAFWEDQANV